MKEFAEIAAPLHALTKKNSIYLGGRVSVHLLIP